MLLALLGNKFFQAMGNGDVAIKAPAKKRHRATRMFVAVQKRLVLASRFHFHWIIHQKATGFMRSLSKCGQYQNKINPIPDESSSSICRSRVDTM